MDKRIENARNVVIETGKNAGMQNMDEAIFKLLEQGLIDIESARPIVQNKTRLEEFTQEALENSEDTE